MLPPWDETTEVANPNSKLPSWEDTVEVKEQEPDTVSNALANPIKTFTEPRDKLDDTNEEYKKAKDAKLKLITDRQANYDSKVSEQRLKSEVKRGKFTEDMRGYESDLEEDLVPDFIDNQKFTNKSAIGYFNKTLREGKEQGLTLGQARSNAIKSLESAGATPLDIQNVVNTLRGVKTPGNINDLGTVAGELQKHFTEGIAQPIATAALNLQLQTMSLDLMLPGPLHFSPVDTVLDVVGTKDKQKDFDELAGKIEGAQLAYRNQYGVGSPIEMTKYAPTLASSVAPAGIVASMALGGFTDAILAKSEGFSNSQIVAQTTYVAGVTGALSGVFKLGSDLFKEMPTTNKNIFTTIDDLPKKYKKQVKKLQRMHGYTDEDVMTMVQGYKEGTEAGDINVIDTIRLLDQQVSGSGVETNTLNMILHNNKDRELIGKDITRRTDEFMTRLNVTKGPLYDSIKKNSINARGINSINWLEVLDESNTKGIVMLPDIKQELEFNAKAFADYDITYHNVIKQTPVTNVGSVMDKVGSLVRPTIVNYLAKHMANAMHMNTLQSFAPYRNLADLLVDIVPVSNQRKQIQKTILKSLEADTFNPNQLQKKIKMEAPEISDAKLEEAVRETIKLKNLAKHSRTPEEAERFYRDEEARMKAVAMEGKQIKTDKAKLVKEEKLFKAKELQRTRYKNQAAKTDYKSRKPLISEKKELELDARYINKFSDIKLTGHTKTDGKKLAKMINNEALKTRKALEKKGIPISMDEARSEVSSRLDRLIKECE